MPEQQDSAMTVMALGESMALFSADTPGRLEHVTRFTRSLAGADSNVAIGLTRLGLAVDWTSRVGDDALGRFILETLQQEGINCDNVTVDKARPTGVQFKSRCDDGSDPDTLYLRNGSAASALAPPDLPIERFEHCDHLHITGIPAALSESARALCHHAMDTMHQAGGSISFDPNLRPSLWPDTATMQREINALATKADWVLPGLEEGQLLTGARQPEAIADFYLSRGAGEVIIKLGAEGAWWQDTYNHLQEPGCQVDQVIDTVGAGDGFAVGFVSARLEQQGVRQALIRGNTIAAHVIGFTGDSEGLPDRTTLAHLLQATPA